MSDGPPGVADVTASPEALLARVARGDERAFEQLYDTLVGAVHGLVLQVVRNPAHAEEVTQEVFVEAWRTAARFDPGLGSVRAWITTMARRRAIDRVRAAQASTDRDVRVGTSSMERDVDVTADAVEVRLEQQQVRRCMGGLTDLQREAVTLAFYRGHTHREVAGLLDVPLGTVKTRLRDGLIRLRDCLGVAS
ncbi:ECF RNA polymerase sigma factor SigK [Kineosporia sp. R_H_3]|uniref:ECF RNA polymerase sigma factor SigK n=1 Tax=Kineosporia sp. R_H_3 TaxID=1961848 RepID=UPI000B4B2290|nr:ECF RNA polymerase sigma factor SigK [Kineosporia sp. R_H_3]